MPESASAVCVFGSKMAGSLYSGEPSLSLEVGFAPIFWQSAAMSGYSTHTVL